MNILQVNYADLPGRIFNGYDLNISLRKDGYSASQAVVNKYSDKEWVIKLQTDPSIQHKLMYLEKKYAMSNLLSINGILLEQEACFQKADVVHYQVIHNDMLSVLDMPRLSAKKKSVWTIHDPWIVTGNCVHPLDCDKWMTGCGDCHRLDYPGFCMLEDRTTQMWNVKKKIVEELDIDIVVSSEFMYRYMTKSPITSSIHKIHKIPFGVQTEVFKNDRQYIRKQYGFSKDDFIVGFRSDKSFIKGTSFILQAFENVTHDEEITFITVGKESVPEKMKQQYPFIQFGWGDRAQMVDFYNLCDVFIMPSLAESFGMMAIEAMAAGCAVICFQNTVLEELVFAPDIGIAVPYKSANSLYKAAMHLCRNREECKQRGLLGQKIVEKTYSFEKYVKAHENLYHSIMD